MGRAGEAGGELRDDLTEPAAEWACAIQFERPVPCWLMASGIRPRPHNATIANAACTGRRRRWTNSSQIASGTTINDA